MNEEMKILFDDEFGTAGMEDDANDWDDYDPNRCPACGADIVFGVCIDPQCMWTPEDDDDDGTEAARRDLNAIFELTITDVMASYDPEQIVHHVSILRKERDAALAKLESEGRG